MITPAHSLIGGEVAQQAVHQEFSHWHGEHCVGFSAESLPLRSRLTQ